MIHRDADRSGTPLVLGGVVSALAVANVARSAFVPSGAHLAFNLGLAAAVVGLGATVGLSRAELGLDPRTARRGLVYGGSVVVAIAVGVGVAALVPPLSGLLEDDRTDVGLADLLGRVLVVIPLGTVLVEELIFRGVIQGLLARLTSPARTLVIGAVIFGLWHVYPAWRASAGDGDLAGFGRLASVAGTFLATAIAGVGFGWLRQRSGSLVAPALAHLATNTIPYTAAWVLAR